MSPQPARKKATLGSRASVYTPALTGDEPIPPTEAPAPSTRTSTPPAPALEPQPETPPAPQLARRPAMTRRIGLAIQKTVQDQAKSAYVVDLDLRADCPPGFTHWLAEAVITHAQLTPTKRESVRRRITPSIERKVPRSYEMTVDAIEAMERAIIEDRTELGHVASRAEFFQTAVLAAIERVKKRSGRDALPAAPSRLPRQPVRR